MTDGETVVAGLGDNRTLANLQENPHAVYLIMEPGEGLTDWKGIRVYLRLADLATSGPALDDFKVQMAKVAGEEAAEMMQAVARFGVTEVRPLIDMGQGWEESI
ncbi:MAG: pyridoxamine 5'-phosphate oxidase family protein [Methanomicrobiales archaeon]